MSIIPYVGAAEKINDCRLAVNSRVPLYIVVFSIRLRDI